MNAKPWIVLSLLLAGLQCAAETPVIYLKNGDSAPGSIENTVPSGNLLWNAPFFATPLEFAPSEIKEITFPKRQARFPSGTNNYSVTTLTGNQLHGVLKSITPDHIQISSLRHGELTLLRKEVASMQNLDEYWQYSVTRKGNWTRSHWYEDKSNQLSTRLRNTSISGTMVLLEPYHVHLKLSWEKTPSFHLGLKQEGGAIKPGIGISLETWEEDLVLLLNNDFLPIRKFPKDQAGNFECHLYVDASKAAVHLFDNNFEHLGTLNAKPGSGMEKVNFRLQNRGEDLNLDSLDVTSWNNQLPSPTNIHKSVRTMDGRTLGGYLHSFSAKDKTLFIPGFPIIEDASFESFSFQPAEPDYEPPIGTVNLQFDDMTELTGVLKELDRSSVKIQIPASKEPVYCKVDGLSSITWNHLKIEKPAVVSEEQDRLDWDRGHLHGTLVPTTEEELPLAWKSSTSDNLIPINKGKTFSIHRAKPAPAAYASEDFPTLLHLNSRMEIPVRIQQFSEKPILSGLLPDELAFKDGPEKKLVIRSPILPEPVLFPSSKIRAVRFPVNGVSTVGKGKWRIPPEMRDNVRHEEGKLLISEKTVFYGYAEPDTSMEILIEDAKKRNFKITVLNSVSESNLKRVIDKDAPDMNGGGWNHRSSYPLPLVNVFREGGSCSVQLMERNSSSGSGSTSRKKDWTLTLKHEDKLNVKINHSSKSLPFVPENPTVLVIEPSGDPLYIQSAELLSGFLAFPVPSTIGKNLTLPRLAAKSPPPNILLAPNGDILRGHLEGITKKTLDFRSIKRRLQIPRERCSAILWMSPPDQEKAIPGISQESVRLELPNGITLPINLESYKDGKLFGTSNELGKCQAHFHSIQTLHFGNSGLLKPLETFDQWQYTLNAPKPLE